ncbi:MAG: histidine phosphatase family protein [Chloroflexota bacterium]|nr:histidine phosphatase family protein [Chloroflexota bacterium]
MKKLSLLRHGKSDWAASFDTDYDRPLKERGRRDVPMMGQFFADVDLVPDLLVSSPATRARQTAELFAEAAGYEGTIEWQESIYAASSGALMQVVRGLANEAGHVLLVGHNPGFEELAGCLVGADGYGLALGVRMPTAAAAHIYLTVERWADCQVDCGQLQWLVSPKLLWKATT